MSRPAASNSGIRMQTGHWKKISEILLDCLEIEASKRDKHLDALNLSPEVRSEIESLLAFEDGVDGLLNLSAVELSGGSFEDDELPRAIAGQKFGNYRAICEIGSGGMGAVYLAERADGKFEQKVALKVLKREMNTAAFRNRFQRERKILASLEHPNIARLLDAGTTEDNIPYIAMEYVDGLPITSYCNKYNLNVEQRLELFREVCRAVDFAHRNLIVHRDLKPSNILVTDDCKPKLLDFGISKILLTDLNSEGSNTITKLGVMTPGYASPEQLQGQSVSTATDVYSLGVILFELLSGHRPFETKENDIKEIYSAIIDSEPPLPSVMAASESKRNFDGVDADPETTADAANRRQTPHREPAETNAKRPLQTNAQSVHLNSSRLRGDLDNIVLMALRKEPERRYSSVEKFSEDLKRHLQGLPVTARPNTLSYRAEKFIKRNKISVIAGGLIVVAIIGGIIATLWQANIARAERSKAERRFNDVRNLANSFLFSLSPKIEKLPGSTPAREELVKLALEYLDSLSQEAGDDMELQSELATAYEKVGDVQGSPSNPNIGDIKGALTSYEKAHNIRVKLFAAEPENQVLADALAQNYKVSGEINANGGDLEKGKAYLEKALALRQSILQSNPVSYEGRSNFAATIVSRGDISFDDNQNKIAIEYYVQAKDIYAKLIEERPTDYLMERLYANIFVGLGKAYGWDNDLKSGEENLNKALAILVKLGDKYPNDQTIQRSLVIAYLRTADNYADFNKEKQGIVLFEKGIEVAQRLSATDPQSVQAKRDLAIITRKLAELLSREGRNQESLEKMASVLSLFKDLREKDPNNTLAIYDVANAQFAAGGTYLALKDYHGGIKILKEAEEGFRKDLSIEPEDKNAARTLAFTLINIATHYTKLAQQGNAREYLTKALKYKREGIELLYKLRNEGKLSEFDNKYVIEAENELTEIEAKLK